MTSKASYFEGENTWVTIADMHQRVVSESKTCISDDAIEAASMEIVPEGSLMYSFKLSVGKVAFAGKDLYTNEAIFSVLPEPEYDLTYFYFALPELLIHSAGQNIYGAKIFNQELLKNAFIALPGLAEQRAIAQFLDAKTTQLDQLIAQKQQMLALLREERAALINHAVTKGLDAGAPLRDSGIAWLGEVPAHWEVKRLKYIAELVNRKVSPSEAEQTLSLENIESWTGRLILLDSQQELESDLQSFQPDDVLFCKLRPYLAKVHLATNNGACVGELLVLRHQEDITPGFLYNRLLSEAFITIVNSSTYGSKMPRASWDFISQLRIPVPPIHEQDEIVKHINSKCEEIEGAVDTINQEIVLLLEYRASLIAEAVTGQIDVRHYEPALEAALM